MRPRHKAAENEPRPGRHVRRISASMRPRHKAAENIEPPGRLADGLASFNEAAA